MTPPTTHQANIDAALLHCAAVQARAHNSNGRDRAHRPTSRRPLAPFRFDDSTFLAERIAESGDMHASWSPR